MKIFNYIKKASLLLSMAALLMVSCNKLELKPSPAEEPEPGTGSTLGELLDDASFSLLKALAVKAEMLPQLSSPSLHYTIFAPDNDAITASLALVLQPGSTPAGYIDSLPAANAKALLQYHIVPQDLPTSSIPDSFPNFEYPSLLNPKPDVSPLLRLSLFPSKRSSFAWVNNIPIIATDIQASNGILHKIARVLNPPPLPLWSRIASDTSLSFLAAAIQRADSGTTATIGTLNTDNLQSVLTEFGPNLTLFAPTNAAFRKTLYGLAYPVIYQQIYEGYYQGAINAGAPDVVAQKIATDSATAKAPAYTTGATSSPSFFQNPALYPYLTAQKVKGIIVYHILGKRAFTVNLPATTENIPTLLNSVLPDHVGVSIVATLTGPVVSSATIKGLINASPANILINPLPNPFGTSDQLFYNGVLHKIDQVLFPLKIN